MSFTACYSGLCPLCGTEMRGRQVTYQTIEYVDQLVHENCPPRAPVCLTCHMEIPLTAECDNCA